MFQSQAAFIPTSEQGTVDERKKKWGEGMDDRYMLRYAPWNTYLCVNAWHTTAEVITLNTSRASHYRVTVLAGNSTFILVSLKDITFTVDTKVKSFWLQVLWLDELHSKMFQVAVPSRDSNSSRLKFMTVVTFHTNFPHCPVWQETTEWHQK